MKEFSDLEPHEMGLGLYQAMDMVLAGIEKKDMSETGDAFGACFGTGQSPELTSRVMAGMVAGMLHSAEEAKENGHPSLRNIELVSEMFCRWLEHLAVAAREAREGKRPSNRMPVLKIERQKAGNN